MWLERKATNGNVVPAPDICPADAGGGTEEGSMSDIAKESKKRKPRRTAEEACIAYAAARDRVRKLTREIGRLPCEVADPPDLDTGFVGDETCSAKYFRNSSRDYRREPDHDDSPGKEFFDAMCSNCKKAVILIRRRSDAKRDFGSRKRAVESVGRRSAQEKVQL